MTDKERNSENDEKIIQKNKEKEISSLISGKILDYKSKLDTVPVQIITIEQSEQDRQEVNNVYSEIESPNTQLLDSKFYTQILKMNRERDKTFLKEGTTRKERIAILAQLISRVTTPILFLNHQRNIHLSNFYVLDETKKKVKEQQKEKVVYEDPVSTIHIPTELSGADIIELRKKILTRIEQGTWEFTSNEKFNLTSWEADIISQLARDEEIEIIVDRKMNKVKIISKTSSKLSKKVISFLIEPQKE